MDESKKRKDPGFPMPPSFMTSDKKQQNNDLMSRLQTFLPEMKAANQALSSEEVGQVDIELKKDSTDNENDGSDSDDDDDSSNASGIQQKLDRKNPLIAESKGEGENAKDEEGTASEPMIQIQFALTDANNPFMEFFANNNEKKGGEDESSSDRDEEDDHEGPSKVRVVKSMLKSASSTQKEEPPKIRILSSDNPAPKKSLITELS